MTRADTLLQLGIALPIALLVAAVIAWVVRRLFGRRLSLPLSVMVIVSVLGLSGGIVLASLFAAGARAWIVNVVLLAFGCSVGLSFLVAGIAAALGADARAVDVAALLAAGENDRVEFKETARWNVREQRKDGRMEQVVAKTVAAFLNSRGGTLVIGADDAGTPLGLDRDFATLRTPDADRFELWLRDMLATSLGKNAAALPRIRFAEIDGQTLCAVRCPRSPEPVFLGKGDSTDLWVRVGNSTRAFGVDEAVSYVSRHFKPSLRTLVLGRP
ncbi:helix-turn-helix domain-containing protein [Microbacterium telephonicum]|uniref:Putative DNA-binding protein n=1 Tax=Microbacterium telephonicum TaxID=1714841 RepID=A0A498BZ90_9MICO|nr:ATP-binding protein [Microbacterium telephonicum]RLK48079.1 putative DNA-binding protein [Microbacterium telephonicum]